MIIGFHFNKLSIEQKNKPVKNMKVRYNIDFPKAEEQALALKTEQKGIRIDFAFTVHYDPNVAVININGNINYMTNAKQATHILDTWKKTKKLPQELSVQVVNIALDRCNIKALELSQDLNLPAHLPMPKVKVGDREETPENYIG